MDSLYHSLYYAHNTGELRVLETQHLATDEVNRFIVKDVY